MDCLFEFARSDKWTVDLIFANELNYFLEQCKAIWQFSPETI